MDLRAASTLARWLGPWNSAGFPAEVRRIDARLPGPRPLRASVYRPPGPIAGVYLLAQGLHFQGPDDPRLDRFCRILAASGVLVIAPFLPDHLALRVTPHTTDDLAAAFDEAERIARMERLPKPAIFSVSFGSQPTLALAARESHRERVGALVIFGGFSSFSTTVRFCLTGRATHAGQTLSLRHDPLNAPVVWSHLLELLDAPLHDRDAVLAAWRTMVERTWGRPELKEPGARDPIAHALAATLHADDREVFLLGCGLRPGAEAHLARIEPRLDALYAFADPRPHLRHVRAPVALVHGRDDDVIPWFEAERLRDALPPGHPVKTLITGLYGHTGAALPSPREIAAEVATMLRVIDALVSAPRSGWTRG